MSTVRRVPSNHERHGLLSEAANADAEFVSMAKIHGDAGP
jgi:hypothetical protein